MSEFPDNKAVSLKRAGTSTNANGTQFAHSC